MKNNNKSVVYHCEEKKTGNPHNDRKLQSNITHQPMNPKTNIKHRQQTNIYNDRNSG
jgi:hypothetical protein